MKKMLLLINAASLLTGASLVAQMCQTSGGPCGNASAGGAGVCYTVANFP